MTFLWILVLMTWPFCISSSTLRGLEIELTEPLIDHQSPLYHGSYESESASASYDINYFANQSAVDLYKVRPGSFLHNLTADDTVFKVFEYLDDDLTNLARLSFTSKRLFRLLTAFFTGKYFQYNHKIFWLLPPQTRFRFALKFLHKFEKQFPGLRGKVNLTLNDLTVLIFLTLHCKNVFFISKTDFDLVNLINSSYKTTADTSKQGLPFYAGSIWRTIITSDAVKHDAFYAIESLCKLDQTLLKNVVKLIAIKLANRETKHGERLPKAVELLLHQILPKTPNSDALKKLLVHSVDTGAISTFAAFLPLWTANLDQLVSESPGDWHVIHKIAFNRFSCPELLSRPELTHFQLSVALFHCEKSGNSVFALELLSRFPPAVFSTHFDPDHLSIIRQIITLTEALQPLHIPQNLHLPVALLLASFHFLQPNALATFGQLIRGTNGRVSAVVLKVLKARRTTAYYELALRLNSQTNSFANPCTLS